MQHSALQGLAPRDVSIARRLDHLRHALGPLVLGLLSDPGVTDIYLNPPEAAEPPDFVWVVRRGEMPEPVGTMSPAQARSLVEAVAGTLETVVNRDRPSVAGELYGDGPRFQGWLPPATISPAWAIRVPSSQLITLEEYVAAGTMTGSQCARIERAITAQENVVVVGGTGTGKTTLLNAFQDAICRLTPWHRLYVIEGTRELRRGILRNVLFVRTTDTYSEQQALRDGLRAFPDRIAVGEVRGAEALDLLMSWNTGHDGGFCSLHARTSRPTPRTALLRLEQMAALSGTLARLQPMISEAVDLIVCLEKTADGVRRVCQMATVSGWDGADYSLTLES